MTILLYKNLYLTKRGLLQKFTKKFAWLHTLKGCLPILFMDFFDNYKKQVFCKLKILICGTFYEYIDTLAVKTLTKKQAIMPIYKKTKRHLVIE
jgi:hypothetical protein